MTLEEFAKDLHQDILARAEDSPNYATDLLTEEMADAMTEAGEADGCIICNCRRRGFKINAYNLSADDDCIDLFVTSYRNEDPPPRIPNSDIDRHFKWLETFFTRSLSRDFHVGLEESSSEFDAAESIFSRQDHITRGRLFFLTDGVVNATTYADVMIEGRRFSHHVWDIERFHRIQTSGAEREQIDVLFSQDFGQTVPCIATRSADGEYTTFLGFFPGSLLVNIYERYGARLLERNVRSFLQARGKINRGIRDTISNESHRFLAYNNGISATAEKLEFIEDGNHVKQLTRALGFQIVNGGQTTASLYAAAKKDKADVSNISVQVKLTVPNDPAAIDELAPRISLYANSQNKVNTADFSANHPFHLRVEELSRTIWAPASTGSQTETKWYYERARGSYLDEFNRAGTPSAQKKWSRQYLSAQKFTKTDLAKFENSWDQLPHVVSRGAEKNFIEFMAKISERHPSLPDDAYYRRLIAKAILFRRTEKLVHAQNYGGYRANIVTYSIAWLSHHTGQRLDLEGIWRTQKLSGEIEEVMRVVSKAAYDHLVGGGKGGNVTEWAKRDQCWNGFRQLNLPATMTTLVLAPTLNQPETQVKTPGNPVTTPAEVAELMNIPAHSWFALSGWAKETMNLAPWQRALAYSLGRLAARGTAPSVKQAHQGRKIMEEAERLGFRPEP